MPEGAAAEVVAQCQTALGCQCDDAFQLRIAYLRFYPAAAGRVGFLLFFFVHIECKILYNTPPVRACERGKNPLEVRNGPAILYDIGISCKTPQAVVLVTPQAKRRRLCKSN